MLWSLVNVEYRTLRIRVSHMWTLRLSREPILSYFRPFISYGYGHPLLIALSLDLLRSQDTYAPTTQDVYSPTIVHFHLTSSGLRSILSSLEAVGATILSRPA